MQESNNSSSLHWILGGALVLIALFVVIALVSIKSQADSVDTSANVTNAEPSIDSVFINDTTDARAATYDESTAITLDPGVTTEIHVNGVISDENGVGTSYANGDLTSITAFLYRTTGASSCSGASTDENDCYTASCSFSSAVDEASMNYDCAFSLEYYADSTITGGTAPSDSWTAKVVVVDDAAQAGDTATQATDVNPTLALTIPASIDYGTLSRSQSTIAQGGSYAAGDAVKMTLTQQGNDVADVEVSGGDMSCTILGTIPVASQQWSLTDLAYDAEGTTALSGSPADTNRAVGYRTGAEVTADLYWNIDMPSAVSGTCTGTTTITAIAS